MIKYYSTNDRSKKVSFKDALLKGLAPDKGLYMPDRFNLLNEKVYKTKNFRDTAFEVSKLFLEEEIPENDLRTIIDNAYDFDSPLVKLHDNIHILELFHGPTAAFKDFGARFMAQVMGYFLKNQNKKITILVATSGDTGSAVAKGFYKVPNIDVVILYPKNKVSFLQEKQLTTLNENITALEVRGTFDDCQRLVKEAFVDKALAQEVILSSANSINIGRLLPQSFYYISAFIQSNNKEVIFCTPSGNFGNLTAGLIAKRMGLPVKQFIAATNENDVIPNYLETGLFNARASVETYSNAMDVGNPSNFSRMLDIYQTADEMKKDIIGYKATDEETLEIINEVYTKYNYILDPHAAVGYKAVKKYLQINNDEKCPVILLGTAHPAKFNDTIEKAIGIKAGLPEVLKDALVREKKSIEIDNNYDNLKKYLLSR